MEKVWQKVFETDSNPSEKKITESRIGVNAAGVTGVRTPPIFDLQGSISVLDPPPNNNTYTIMHRPTAHYFRQLCGGAVEEQ